MSQVDVTTRIKSMTQERPPYRMRWPNHGPPLKGWLACDMGQPIADNPYDPYTDMWYEWRDGWFVRDQGEDAIIPCNSWDEVPNE